MSKRNRAPSKRRTDCPRGRLLNLSDAIGAERGRTTLVRSRLTKEVSVSLAAEAARLRIQKGGLAGLILTAVVKGNLVDAVLDAESEGRTQCA